MKRFLIIAWFGALVACSTEFAYNNLDWILPWYVDDYVELNDQQDRLLDIHIESVLQWHRQEELQAYHDQLTQLKADVMAQALTGERWQFHINEFNRHLFRLRRQLAPKLLALSKSADEEQVEQFFKKLEASNLELEQEHGSLTISEQKEQRLETLQESFEDKVGSLNEQQVSMLVDYVDKLKPSFSLRLAYHRSFQKKLKGLILTPQVDNYDEQFVQLLLYTQKLQSAELRQVSQHNRQLTLELLQALSKSLSPRQQQTFIVEIEALMATLQSLRQSSMG